ncbi:hypothetical protein L2K20_27045 [Mycobacterium sp. MBM]|nr:hypothetical protein [Mycobacterium sp. MBM]
MDRPARRPGPPVDAACLQPDNQPDIQDVDEGLVGAWLDDPHLAAELADELERLRRLQADEELLLALQFVVAPNAEYIGLAAGGGADQAEQIIVLGPSRIPDLAVHEIDLALDALQRGDRQIVLDEDGDPRLIGATRPGCLLPFGRIYLRVQSSRCR